MNVVHVIGNGNSSGLYLKQRREGIKICCNQVAFEVPDKAFTSIVDYKMMNSLTLAFYGQAEGLVIPGMWLLGKRPQMWMEKNPTFYMNKMKQVKEFYTHLPEYTYEDSTIGKGYTRWNCGHMSVHYACNVMKAKEVHLYGFDSIMDFDTSSLSDLIMNDNNRDLTNTDRSIKYWRHIWKNIFAEFPDTKFIIHYRHDDIKIEHKGNVSVVKY